MNEKVTIEINAEQALDLMAELSTSIRKARANGESTVCFQSPSGVMLEFKVTPYAEE